MKRGEKVRFQNHEGDGIIIDVLENGKYHIQDNEGFEWIMPESELIKIDMREVFLISNNGTKCDNNADKDAVSSRKTGGKGTRQKVIDLHQGALPGYSQNMTPAEIHELQKETITMNIEKEKNHHGTQLVFIHGKGEGVLRSDLIRILKRYKSICRYEDAPFHTYGYRGAIKVFIK